MKRSMEIMSNEEILRRLHHGRELFSALYLDMRQTRSPFVIPSTIPMSGITYLDNYQIWDCSNKPVPIYYALRHLNPMHLSRIMLTAYGVRRDLPQMFTEFQRFLSKTIVYGRVMESGLEEPVHLLNRPLDQKHFAVGNVMRSHQELCEQFVQLRCQISNEKANGNLQEYKYGQIDFENYQAFQLKPLFRALAIILLDDPPAELKNAPDKVQMFPVRLVWSGSNEGLGVCIDLSEVSSVITTEDGGFRVAETTLLKALHFVSTLEQRQLEFEKLSGCKLSGNDIDEIPDWRVIGGSPPEEYLKRRGVAYRGPRITPEQFVQHRDKTVFPQTLSGAARVGLFFSYSDRIPYSNV